MLATGPVAAARTAAVEAPRSLLELAATSAPSAIIQMLFMILVIYFFLAGWTRLRNQTISSRGSFDGAMTIARVIQNVVDATSAYVTTIAVRSEEHTSELQSLMRISYAVFCLK